MTRTTVYDWIADLGITLEYTTALPPKRLGAYLDDEKRILIRTGLTRPLEDETVHHEYVHAWYHDRTTSPDIEARTWRETALLLVDPHEYAAAEQLSASSQYIAHELETTVRIIETYRGALAEHTELIPQAA